MTEPNVRRLLRASRLCNELGHGDDVAAALDEMKRLRAENQRLLYLQRENARLRRRIMADSAASTASANSIAKLAQALVEARAEIERLQAGAEIGRSMSDE